MCYKTDKRYVNDINKIYDYKLDKWIDIIPITSIGKVINEHRFNVMQVVPIQRGIKITSQMRERSSYVRKDIATINCNKYDDAIRSLSKQEFIIWENIKKRIEKDTITFKLNAAIIKDITKIEDRSLASKIIKHLVASGLIIKSKRYKDLYCINPNIYFRGDYNKFAIEYINSGFNSNSYPDYNFTYNNPG